ncbi:MAG: hypothetical protein C0404_03265 [Verrucomicrobia bacterium]|nr:hypothetical protein [Verrucomicrobiota bacterium]
MRYRRLFETAQDGILILDAGSGTIRDVNPFLMEMLGCVREDVVGRKLWEMGFFKDVQRSREAFLRLQKDGYVRYEDLPLERKDGTVFEVEFISNVYTVGDERVIQCNIRDITERKRIEHTLRFLAQSGGTASSGDFFQALARYLAQSLSMDYVCIDRLETDLLSAQTVAVYYEGKFEDNISYTLKDTPCGDVVAKKTCCFPRDARRLFPKDEVLQRMSAESYAGTILWSSRGKPIGLIAVIGRRPLAYPGLVESVLQLVAVRAAGELDRWQMEEVLRAGNAELTHFNSAMVDRELRMIELKKRINELCVKAGLPPEYKLEFGEK